MPYSSSGNRPGQARDSFAALFSVVSVAVAVSRFGGGGIMGYGVTALLFSGVVFIPSLHLFQPLANGGATHGC